MRMSRWIIVLLAITLAGAGNSWADHGYRGGHGGGHGGGYNGAWAGIGLAVLVLGAALYPQPLYAAAPYYSPYYAPYYPPVTIVEAAPAVYVNPAPVYAPAPAQNPQVAQAPDSADWYYCKASKSYYPYVRECPAGWLRVPSHPPGY